MPISLDTLAAMSRAERNQLHQAEQAAEHPARRREDFAAELFRFAVANMEREFWVKVSGPARRKDDTA